MVEAKKVEVEEQNVGLILVMRPLVVLESRFSSCTIFGLEQVLTLRVFGRPTLTIIVLSPLNRNEPDFGSSCSSSRQLPTELGWLLGWLMLAPLVS